MESGQHREHMVLSLMDYLCNGRGISLLTQQTSIRWAKMRGESKREHEVGGTRLQSSRWLSFHPYPNDLKAWNPTGITPVQAEKRRVVNRK